MQHFGRRTLYLAGFAVLFALLIIIGGLGFAHSQSASWGIGTLVMIFTFVYDLTIGPVCYSLVAEIPSTRLKIKTVVLARNFYNIAGLINNAIVPDMLGVNSWNWGPKSGLFWAGAVLILFTWSYFRLPEPRNRTYGELDILFEHRVSARKFSSTSVDQFSGEHVIIVPLDTIEEKQNEGYDHKD
jgi:SP family general alpha glucoside:H+ symporter-like MFS transporter